MKRENDAHLPFEIVVIILSMLPVKILLQLRCVCKEWYNLITTPEFIATYTAAHNNDFKYVLHKPLSYTFFQCIKPYENECRLLDLPPLMATSKVYMTVHGSCNGLLFVSLGLYSHSTFVLWNPAVKKLKLLPRNYIQGKKGSQCNIGFGFCKKGGGYKAVKLTCLDSKISRPGSHQLAPMVVEVYTLGINSWKRIEDLLLSGTLSYSNSISVEGALHWICCNPFPDNHELFKSFEGGQHHVILSFDLEREVWTKMMLPRCDFPGNQRCFCVGNIRDSLCSMSFYHSGYFKSNIWVMREYGVTESWTKLYTFDLTELIERPVCIGSYGFIVRIPEGGFKLYEFEDRKWKDIEASKVDRAYDYCESLVLVDEENND